MKTEDVINRMYNWKMSSAYDKALEVPNFPKTALKLLKDMSDKFGNVGWSEGVIFDELRNTNNKVAEILGYVYDDEKDNFIKK